MGREPVLFRGRPCDWPGCAASTNPSVSFTHLLSRVIDRKEAEVRYIGLDVHREFCEVAISEEGRVRSAGRVRTRRAELELFAQSLGKDDEVALESTGGAEEIAEVDRALSQAALGSAEMRRLMTVPGVNLHTAATFMACVGDIGRFPSPRKLVSYLGLDPKVRQSGEEPARHGHISKEGASEARHMLCEAAWIVVRSPSPLRAFGERIRARRGAGIATVAVARKAETAYRRLVADWQPKKGADATPGRASLRRQSGKQRGRASVPDPAL